MRSRQNFCATSAVSPRQPSQRNPREVHPEWNMGRARAKYEYEDIYFLRLNWNTFASLLVWSGFNRWGSRALRLRPLRLRFN